MLYKQIDQNKRKTVLLMALFSLVVIGVGWGIGYLFSGDYFVGLVITAIILAIYIPITYMTANSQVLRMSGARQIQKEDHPMVYNIVEELSLVARVPMPNVYIIDDPSPNAFATGTKPKNGSVAFTTGLLERLNREEIEGVAAHEIAHIRNYDIRLMTICIALVGVVVLIANIGSRMLFLRGRSRGGNQKSNAVVMLIALLFVILAPIAARFVKLAVSRNREYLADASAVEFTRNPEGLKQALRKISRHPQDVQRASDATAAMYISNPLRKTKKKRNHWFSTHPPIESRIERLDNM